MREINVMLMKNLAEIWKLSSDRRKIVYKYFCGAVGPEFVRPPVRFCQKIGINR